MPGIERWRRPLDGVPLTRDQRISMSGLLREASQLGRIDPASERYRAWWGRLEGLVRQIQSTLGQALSDAEWDALETAVFIAWEETGIQRSHLDAGVRSLHARVADQDPSPASRSDPTDSPGAGYFESLAWQELLQRPSPPSNRPGGGIDGPGGGLD